MSGIGTSELILLFVVGLLVLGPERLPKVASQVGRWVGRARREAYRLRQQLEREIALSEMRRTRAHESPPSKGTDSKQAQSDSVVRTEPKRKLAKH
jgi:sec-independent protein translocase protein TatB